ncbi:MAG: hypothetical protein LBD23_18635, partial [Oscillospiraceae bacterium]|nr:hypothetical protein [Oscillospiraceae bacterium]
MHKINEYIFDSDRVVLYKADLDDKIVAELKSTFKSSEERYNLIYSSLMKMDSEHMCMNKVEIDNFGIMLTYNCNLRCRYCAYSSGGESECKLKSSDVEAFVD